MWVFFYYMCFLHHLLLLFLFFLGKYLWYLTYSHLLAKLTIQAKIIKMPLVIGLIMKSSRQNFYICLVPLWTQVLNQKSNNAKHRHTSIRKYNNRKFSNSFCFFFLSLLLHHNIVSKVPEAQGIKKPKLTRKIFTIQPSIPYL